MLPAPFRIPSHWPLASNFTSVSLSANDNDNNGMIPGAVHRSPGIYLTGEENPWTFQLGNHDEDCEQSLPQRGIPYLQMRSVVLHSMSGREQERKGWIGKSKLRFFFCYVNCRQAEHSVMSRLLYITFQLISFPHFDILECVYPDGFHGTPSHWLLFSADIYYFHFIAYVLKYWLC